MIALPVRVIATRGEADCRDVDSSGIASSNSNCDKYRYSIPPSVCSKLSFTLSVRGVTEVGHSLVASVDTSFRCRTIDEPFVFTFLDHDGSVSSTGVTAPLGQHMSGIATLPITLSLHGTGVSGQSQAEAYKYKTGNEKHYTFGIADSWLLTPDRHGAHNWEYTGHYTAMSAVAAFSQSLSASVPLLDQRSCAGTGYGNSGFVARFASVVRIVVPNFPCTLTCAFQAECMPTILQTPTKSGRRSAKVCLLEGQSLVFACRKHLCDSVHGSFHGRPRYTSCCFA